jgi:hypothetical protein
MLKTRPVERSDIMIVEKPNPGIDNENHDKKRNRK